MKFGKHFKRQKVPEWTDAYMDYNGLKRVLREIVRYKQSFQPGTPLRTFQRTALYRSFSGLTKPPSNPPRVDADDQVIDISALQRDGSRQYYATNFLRQSEVGGEIEATFFRKLDEELNKVNTFYTDKVEEVMQEANSLNKQMDALIALRIKVEKPDDGFNSERLCADGAATEPSASNDIKGNN